MKYFMIGGDKREYGPIDAELLKQWVREGRANGDTLLRAENEADWRPLRTFGELQIQTAPPPPPLAPAGPPPLQPSAPASIAVEATDAPVSVGHAFARAWHLVGQHFGLVASASLTVWLVFTASVYMPCFGLLAMVFYGPLFGGLFMMFLKLIREGDASPSDVFALTRETMIPLMLTGVVTLLLSQLAMILCYFPKLYLQIAWIFALPLVADRKLGFWDAMELSRRAVTRRWFKVFGLCILAFLPYVVFGLYMEVRKSIDIYPISKSFWALLSDMMSGGGTVNEAAIDRMVQEAYAIEKTYVVWGFFRQVLLLISLPLGIGSLAFVYEDLFGRKK